MPFNKISQKYLLEIYEIFTGDLHNFIGDPHDSHWRPPRFLSEAQNICLKPSIFIGDLKIFIEDPNFSSETPIFSFGIPNF